MFWSCTKARNHVGLWNSSFLPVLIMCPTTTSATNDDGFTSCTTWYTVWVMQTPNSEGLFWYNCYYNPEYGSIFMVIMMIWSIALCYCHYCTVSNLVQSHLCFVFVMLCLWFCTLQTDVWKRLCVTRRGTTRWRKVMCGLCAQERENQETCSKFGLDETKFGSIVWTKTEL